MSARTIDLNADLGEGCQHDDDLLDVVTSASIACGGHAGDADSMNRAVAAAVARGVVIGAHPSYPDRENFGRLPVSMPAETLLAELTDQVRALADVARAHGTAVRYLKAHGALYNAAMVEPEVAAVVLEAARSALAQPLPLYALPGSVLHRAAVRVGTTVLREGFADRAARSDGTLVPRGEPGAVLTDPQVLHARMAHVAATADTVCVHGDTPAALTLARAARAGLREAGYDVVAWLR